MQSLDQDLQRLVTKGDIERKMFALASADASDKIFAASCAVIRVSNVDAAMGEIAFKIFSLSSAVPAYNAADALSSSIATNAAAKARSSCMAANTLAASSGSIISKHAPAKFGFIPQSISAAASSLPATEACRRGDLLEYILF